MLSDKLRGISFTAAISTVTYLATVNDTSDASSYTFNNVSFGQPDAKRHIFVFVSTNRAVTATNTISSVTIAGTAGTLAVKRDNVGTLQSGIYFRNVPTGNTGSIVVSLTSVALRCSIIVMALYEYSSVSVSSSNTAGANSSTPLTVTVNTPSNGLLLGFVSKRIDNPVLTTGISETLDSEYSEDYGFSAGYTYPTSAVTGQTVGTSYTVSSQSQLLAASFSLTA